jgi:nardilysin
LSKFIEVASAVLENLSAQALFHGNVDKKEANSAADLIESMMKASPGGVLQKKKYYYQYVAKIPEATTPIVVTAPSRDEENGNTAVEVYFQVGKDNIVDRVLIDMLIHLMAEPLYNQLRTKEQFGYRVSCDSRWTVGVMGMKFVVVTATKSAVSTNSFPL